MNLERDVALLKARLDMLEARLDALATPSSDGAADADAARSPAPSGAAVDAPRPAPAADEMFAPAIVFEAADAVERPRRSARWRPEVLPPAAHLPFGGNPFALAGCLLLIIGAAFLIRYASLHVSLPLQLRVVMTLLLGGGMVAGGYRMRAGRESFALPLQGAGVAVLYLASYAATRVLALWPAHAAWPALGLVAGLAALLAARQRSQPLGVMALAGGVAAPVLLGDGRPDAALLLGYLVVLNAGVVALAACCRWRLFGQLGYLATYALAMLSLSNSAVSPVGAPAQGILWVLFALYGFLQILAERRVQMAGGHGPLDAVLVAGLPAGAFTCRWLADGQAHAVAANALLFAAIYLAAWLALRKRLPRLARSYRLIVLCFGTLALGAEFEGATLAVALSIEATALTACLPGGASRGRVGAAALLGAAWIAALCAVGWSLHTAHAASRWTLAGIALVGLLTGACGFLVRRHWRVLDGFGRLMAASCAVAAALLVCRAAWLLVQFDVAADILTNETSVWLLFLWSALLVVFLLEAARLLRWAHLRGIGALALFALAGRLTLVPPPMLAAKAWVLLGAGLTAVFYALWRLRAWKPRYQLGLHALWGVALTHLLLTESWGALSLLGVDRAWRHAVDLLWMAAAVRLITGPLGGRWPVRRMPRAWKVYIAGFLVGLMVLRVLQEGNWLTGDQGGLPYLPLLNTADLALAAVFFAAWVWSRAVVPAARRHVAHAVLLAAAFGEWLFVVGRAVSHWTGTPYRLAALWPAVGFQAALSLSWAAIAVALALVSARRRWRLGWQMGALLLAATCAKLLLYDLYAHGALLRVLSFLGVGAMILMVGYVCPAPPVAGRGSPGLPGAAEEPAPEPAE